MDRLPWRAEPEEAVRSFAFEGTSGRAGKEERQLIYLRYFADRTQAQAGKELGISQVQVSRLEKKILKSMREQISRHIRVYFLNESSILTTNKKKGGDSMDEARKSSRCLLCIVIAVVTAGCIYYINEERTGQTISEGTLVMLNREVEKRMTSGSETIYIKADRNIEVTKPDVTLGGMYLKYRVSIHLLL